MAIVYGTNIENNAVPSLDLRFADRKNLIDTISGKNLIDFSRVQSGTSKSTYFGADGVLKYADSNEPRFDHDPMTGESLGLLVEEQRVNNLKYSTYFDNAAWTKSRTTINANAATAPDGTITADKLIRGTDININVVYQTVSLPQTTYTFSVFAKKGEYNFCTLVLPGTQGWDTSRYISVDLRDGSYEISSPAPTSTSVEEYPSGWYRISITHAASATVTRGGYIEARSSSGYGNQAGDGTSGIYIWGAQLETGSFPTSYIPTPATFVSRADSTQGASYYDANGIIQYTALGAARDNAYFPDENGAMKPAGLLLEAAAANLITQSDTLSSFSYTAHTLTTNATISPDGTANASRVTANGGGTAYRFVTTSNPSTFSVYFKADSVGWVKTNVTGAGDSWFNLQTGEKGTGAGAIQKLPNGWNRISVYTTSTGSIQTQFFPTVDNNSYDRTSGNAIFVWGAQLEESPYPTSYIPTAGSTVTRAADVSSSSTVTRSADVAQITGANFSSWWNQAEGTAFVNYKTSSREQFNSPFSFRISAASNVQSWGHWTYNGGSQSRVPIYGQRPSPNEPQYLIGTFDSIDLNRYYKVAISQDGSNMSGCIETDTTRTRSMTALPAMSVLTIGWINSTSTIMTGHISRLTYYPQRLQDTTLQKLTR